MKNETKIKLRRLSIDGGVSRNDLICEKIASLVQRPVKRALDSEASARGASFFAGIGAGIYTIDSLPDIEQKAEVCPQIIGTKEFDICMSEYIHWKAAIKRTLKWQQMELEEPDTDTCFKQTENSIL